MQMETAKAQLIVLFLNLNKEYYCTVNILYVYMLYLIYAMYYLYWLRPQIWFW